MRNYIKEEFKRAFLSINTLLAFLLCFCTIGINFINTNIQNFAINKNAATAFKLIFQGRIDIIFFLFASLIASLPYASSYAIDKKSGYYKSIFIRLEPQKYLSIRYFVNGIIGGSILAISLTISLIVLLIVFRNYPITPIPTLHNGQYLAKGAFSSVFNSNPLTYAFICILMSFAYGFIFSTLGFAISVLTENEYLSVVFPFLFPILITMIFGTTPIDAYISAETIFFPERFSSSTELQYFTGVIGWLAFSTTLLIIGFRKAIKNV